MGNFYIKECIDCKEVMPAHEKVCYCGGGIFKRQGSKDEKEESIQYYGRKWLFSRIRRK